MKRSSLLLLLLVAPSALLEPRGASAQSCSAAVPHVEGQWQTLPYRMPINPISTTLLHDGRVLIVSGSEADASNNSKGSESYRIALWDPTGRTQASIVVDDLEYDVFCSGTAVLPDGRPLVVGGTSDYSFAGEARSSIYDPARSGFLQTQDMADGRWYGTATALGDGRIMAFSGLGLGGDTNSSVEIYDPSHPGSGWSSPVLAPFLPPVYPRMFLLPSGKVFFTGQNGGGSAWIFDPGPRSWKRSAPPTMNRTFGSAVLLPLLPPDYRPRVMNIGGGNPTATASTEIIDLSAAQPTWQPAASMSSARIQMNAVLLPSGRILAEGGSQNNEIPSTPGKRADLYDPLTDRFSPAGTAAFSRLYHSTALLLPDATVASVGSNPPPNGSYEPAIEIYTPAYLFDARDQLITDARPSITALVPASPLGYGASFTVRYTSQSPILSAVLVRPGSPTHAFDMEQRLIGLCGASPQPPCTGSGGTLELDTPPNGKIAPPGWYMLFLIDSAGVPSKARFLQLSSHKTIPPSGVIDSPPTDVTVTAGNSVRFSTRSSAARYSWVFPGGSPAASTRQTPGNVSFAVPGEYTASLTLVDSSGNSDPSPPTRSITVLPPTPDFDIDVTPSSRSVVPGGSAAFDVTVRPKSGFGGTVLLGVGSESGFPSGITSGGFSPSSIAAGGGSSTLSMNVATSASPYALSLTVIGSSGSLRHTASSTLLVNLASPASLSATPGNGQISLSWAAVTGATSYRVKRAPVSGGPYAVIGCATSAAYTDAGLTNGTRSFYVVSAAYSSGPNAGGEGPDSVQAGAAPCDHSDDADCDGLSNGEDLCPFYPSTAAETDEDANGIGDDCECGDQNGDGRVDVADLVAIKMAIFGAIPASPLCDTNDDGKCDVQDIVSANQRIFGRPAYCSRYPPPVAP